MSGAVGNPSEETLVIHFLSRSPTTWNDKDIQRWAIIEIVVREDLHPAGGHQKSFRFGYQKNIERRRFLPPSLLVQTGDRKDLEWSTKIEYLNVLEYNDSCLFPVHF